MKPALIPASDRIKAIIGSAPPPALPPRVPYKRPERVISEETAARLIFTHTMAATH